MCWKGCDVDDPGCYYRDKINEGIKSSMSPIIQIGTTYAPVGKTYRSFVRRYD